MRLKALTLQNFRRYRSRTVIDIDEVTAFIGRGDAGKSTILEALDIFFEGGVIKIDPADACISGEAKDVRIGAIFTNLPEKLDLDRGAHTTLQDEYLTNGDGDLEIIKIYDCSVQRMRGFKVSVYALHPSADGVDGLLQMRNSALKKLVKTKGVEGNCQLSHNPSMRHALYEATDDLRLVEKEVLLNKEDAKNIWNSVKQNLPVYALFRSDRASSDQDPEVQNPMKLAIQSALARLASELEEISQKVEESAEQIAHRTLDQLRKSYPDIELASVLKPRFRKPNWATVFKLELESDDQVPLNKRGSGVRRLILLSFFQAEAARLREKRQEENLNRVPVIYAVEEPETSQHPDNQERIIRAFREVAEGGDQVLLTTHVPGLAGLLPLDSLRFVDTAAENQHVRVRKGTPEVFEEIADALGVLPDASDKPGAKVAVAVEGPTDIDALVSFAKVLTASGELQSFDHSKVFWTIGGGETLKDWVERRYLDRIGIPQIYLFDSDRKSSAELPSKKKQDLKAEIERRQNCRAFISHKRTIENYVHRDAIERQSNCKIRLRPELNPDYDDVATEFKIAFEAAKNTHGNQLDFYPDGHDGQQLGMMSGKTNCKKIITAYIMRHMTADEIGERGKYTREDGEESNEIMEWLEAIQASLEST